MQPKATQTRHCRCRDPAASARLLRCSAWASPSIANAAHARQSLAVRVAQARGGFARTLTPKPSDPFANITEARGFLPAMDPCTSLAHLPEFQPWEQAASDIPKLCVISGAGRLRKVLRELPPFPLQKVALLDMGQQWRAYSVLSFIAHAYMWCEKDAEVPQVLPSLIAVPWSTVAKSLDMPPVLTYATYNLLNWRRIDPNAPVELGNIVCINNFLGGQDEEHFRCVHIDIEARAAPAIARLLPMQDAAQRGDDTAVAEGLATICSALEAMQHTLSRMGEKCDPYVYYHRVRLPMSGWKNNPALPKGLIYEGVSTEPVQLYGETGAQSSILHSFDATLGIQHEDAWLKTYLQDMMQHMPPTHRGLLTLLQINSKGRTGTVRSMCTTTRDTGLKDAYNETVHQLEKFRSQHKAFAASYIARHSDKEVGTGGSDFMPALAGYRDTTAKHKVA